MAGDSTMKTMGDLAVLSPKDKDESEVFAELVGIIQNNYPSGWEDWKVVDLSHEELFGEELSAATDSKLRFAIPSVELVKAFFPNAKDLSERAYRGIRKTLLKWPLGRALIYSPHSVVEKLHSHSYKAFMGVVREMKLQGKLTNRDATSRILSEGEEQRSCSTPRSTTPQSKRKGFSAPRNLKRHLDIEECSTPPPKKNPGSVQQGSSEHLMASVLQQQMEFFNKLLEMQSDQNRKFDELHKYSSMKASPLDVSYESRSENIHREAYMSPEPSPILCSEEEEESVQNGEPDHESLEEEIRKTDQRLKELQALKASGKSPRRHSTETSTFNFKPHTTESEGRLSKADPVLAQQGMDCQRLGTDGWTNIKYKDVQKKFQATPVFSSLKVNNQLAGITPRWTSVQILEKMDLTLAAVTNGLLQQRKIFDELYDKLPEKLKQKIGEEFLANNSKFRQSSDDLLQYVCGRRAEIIQQRRSTYRIKNKALHEVLHNIPPSDTHLFKEPELSQTVKDQGGIHKFFPYKKTFKSQQSAKGETGTFRKVEPNRRFQSGGEAFKRNFSYRKPAAANDNQRKNLPYRNKDNRNTGGRNRWGGGQETMTSEQVNYQLIWKCGPK